MAFLWRAWLIASDLAAGVWADRAAAVRLGGDGGDGGIVVAISNAKRRYLREPLVFSDFALLEHVVRHPQLFYVPRRWMGAVIAGVIALLAAIVGWMLIEPRAAGGADAGLLAADDRSRQRPGSRYLGAVGSAAALVREPDIEADVARIGLLVSLAGL